MAAVFALRDLKDARAVEPLIEALKDGAVYFQTTGPQSQALVEMHVRDSAARALMKIGGVKAQEALNLFFKDIDLKNKEKQGQKGY